jgi:CheY-like chemotaxis protein
MKPHNGLDLLERAKSEPALQVVPVVIISSTASGTNDRAECLKRGAVNFIKRPIEPQALLTEIAKALSDAQQQ